MSAGESGQFEEGPTGGLGKWAEAGVPHRGWTCVDQEDLGSPSAQCEMCERQTIRYVQYMKHPNYPEVLACGCICAGHMEENLAGAKAREVGMRTAARRRRAWPDRKAWRLTAKGNLHIAVDGYMITVFRKDSQWSAVISNPAVGLKRFARRVYPSARAAQLATFDALSFLRALPISRKLTD